MIEETSTVVDLDGDRVCLETGVRAACAGCSVARGCGAAIWSKVFGVKAARMWVKNTVHAELADEVVVGVSEDALVRASLAVYALPLLALIFGAALGQWYGNRLGLNNADGLSILAGTAGLAFGFFKARAYAARVSEDERFQPVLLRVTRRSTQARDSNEEALNCIAFSETRDDAQHRDEGIK